MNAKIGALMIDKIAQEGKARGGTEREKAKKGHVRPVPKKTTNSYDPERVWTPKSSSKIIFNVHLNSSAKEKAIHVRFML